MADSASENQPPLPLMHGRRTRIAVAIMGCMLSLGVPIAALSSPGLVVNEQTVRIPDDPAGLGASGALPGDPLPSDAAWGIGAGAAGLPAGGLPASVTPGDSAIAVLPGIPTPLNLPDGPLGIPGVVLDAYQFAQRTLVALRPGCHLPWSVLAGIGRIESNHASDGRVDAFGNTLGPILGPRLDGSPGIAAVADTDHATLDGDTVWDRAVGPMQFIPSTWRSYGVDGNGDGVGNPNNIYDATITAGLYLCAGSADLADPAQLQAAVFRYNHSATYVDIVLQWARAYLTGVIPTPSAPGPVPPGTNGNGGLPILLGSAPPPAAPPAAVAQTVPLPSTPTPKPASTPSTSPSTSMAITTPPPTVASGSASTTTTTTPSETPSPDIPSSSPSPPTPLTGTATPPSTESTSTPLPTSPTTAAPATPAPTMTPSPAPAGP
jgi:Transglycosylase SLT domain